MRTSSKVNDFGSLLRLYRADKGLTQQQLADFSAMSVRAIRDLELGRAERPRWNTVRLLADALRLDGPGREVFERAARPASAREDAEPPGPRPEGGPGECSYEYATVLLDSLSSGSGDGQWAEALNDMAQQSWRLITVYQGVAFMERQLSGA